jgi:homoserine O-acetyltransferase/O-succinyltransferase
MRQGPIAVAVVAAALAGDAGAAEPKTTEGDVVLRDMRFVSGETLPEVKLHYTTLGTPRRDAAGHVVNAVLALHGTSGTGKTWLNPGMAGELFGPGQPLDASRYYVILPDGLGRGGSSKPSDGLRSRFPRYGYTDVVEAQHYLVAQGLGIDHLRLVIGTSMGGMQCWMWGERWPKMMDAIMPLGSQPVQISGRNLIWRRAVTESIRHDPGWKDGFYETPPTAWIYAAPFAAIMADSPVKLQAAAPNRQAAVELYDKMVERARGLDANDYLYWFESSWDYDPEPQLGLIEAPLLAVNFADDEINPPELGLMERLVAKLPHGRFVLVPAGENTYGHATLARAAVWRPYLEELLRALPER